MKEAAEVPIYKILQRVTENIFNLNNENDFEYYKREDALKRNIIKTFDSLEIHIKEPGIDYELDHWEKYMMKRNLENLIKYINKLYHHLEREKIIEFCNKHERKHLPLIFEDDEIVLIINSFYTTIVYDILWSSNISVSDAINLSKGKIDYKNIIRKFPKMIKDIELKIIPYLDSIEKYKQQTKVIKEAKETFQLKLNKATSALILIAIEGLVRILADFLIEKQEIDKSKLEKNYNSLDSLLRKIPWKEDYEIESSKLMFITGDYAFHKEYVIGETKKINLHTRLNFLKRRFRTNRNSILHGDGNFGETWDLYVNFSALNEVHKTIEYYEILYNPDIIDMH